MADTLSAIQIPHPLPGTILCHAGLFIVFPAAISMPVLDQFRIADAWRVSKL